MQFFYEEGLDSTFNIVTYGFELHVSLCVYHAFLKTCFRRFQEYSLQYTKCRRPFVRIYKEKARYITCISFYLYIILNVSNEIRYNSNVNFIVVKYKRKSFVLNIPDC